jgi:hypothetical protein
MLRLVRHLYHSPNTANAFAPGWVLGVSHFCAANDLSLLSFNPSLLLIAIITPELINSNQFQKAYHLLTITLSHV